MADTTASNDGAQAPPPLCLSASLAQASLQRPVFALWGIGPDGRCECGALNCSAGKHPIHAGGFKNATTVAASLVAEFREHPNANLGLRTGKTSGIVVVDLDYGKLDKDGKIIDGRETLAALIKKHGGDFPENLCMVFTGGGGLHLYFKYPKGFEGLLRNSAGTLGPGTDFRGDGGYVVAPPSRHVSGKLYAWANETEPPDLPKWLFELLCSTAKKSSSKSGKAKTFKEGGRNDALTSHAGRMRHGGLSENVIRAALLELNRETCTPPLSDEEVGKIATSVANYEPGAETDAALKMAEATDGEPWAHLLSKNKEGMPNASTLNVILTLENDKYLRGVFQYNERASSAYVVKQPPWHLPGQKVPRAALDSDIGELATRQAGQWLCHTPLTMAFDAMNVVAHRSPYDPVVDRLESLVWDGKVRLPFWLRDYCGAEDNEHTRLVSTRFPISAAARAYRPGCKADQVLTLEGAQGVGKSTVAQILAMQEDWYTDDLDDLGSVKTAERLQGKWFAEIAELAAMNGRDIEVVKAFISRTADNYRGAYLKVAELHPRRCVFIATTNGGKYLNDPSGARRFWVVKVGLCDTDGLRAVVDQLWAEAVVRYKANEVWYSNREESKVHAEAAEDAQAEDMWATKLEPWLAVRKVVTLEEVAKTVFEIDARDFRKNQMQLSAVMKRAGWVSKQARVHEMKQRIWFAEKTPPTNEELEKFFVKAQGPSLRVVK